MKKIKSKLKQIILPIIGLLFINIFIGAMPPPNDSELVNENIQLMINYEKMVNDLTKMEQTLNEIKNFDNKIYGQMLGVEFDSTLCRNNDFRFSHFNTSDSMFLNIDERILNSSISLANHLNDLQSTYIMFENKQYYTIQSYPTISPINVKDFKKLTSPFGYRIHPIRKVTIFHNGIDISANQGAPVHSTAQGMVVSTIISKHGYGNKIIIEHKQGFETIYAHLNSIDVIEGQWVDKNQVIGTVGHSGLATGNHLHYEIHKNGVSCDPLGYFYLNINRELLTLN